MARALTIRQRDSLRQFQPDTYRPPVASAGQPLEVYQERSPWSMWGPVLALAVILCATLLAVVYLWNTGAISLAEIDLATEQARLEHARLMGADEGWSTGQVTGLVAAILLGVVAVPSVAITCARI